MLRFLIPLMIITCPVRAEVPNVVTDIAPVHSLVAQVMDGVGTPALVVPPGASPHHHAMRPSEARALADADMVIWVGAGLTPWLQGPIDTLASKAAVMSLMNLKGVHLLPFREGALFEIGGHDHDREGEEETGAQDPHVWLDPDNGILFLGEIAAALAQIDPENADIYIRNARAGAARIAALDIEIDAQFATTRGIPFAVLHDGFHYFEDHFAIEAVAAIASSDAQTPGAARVRALRDAFAENTPRCAFSEPQVGTGLVDTVSEGMNVKIGVMDPLGTLLPLGPSLYPDLLRGMADAMVACLEH